MNITQIQFERQTYHYLNNLKSYGHFVAPNFNKKVVPQDCFVKTTTPINFKGQLFLGKDELPKNSFEIFTQEFRQNYGNASLENVTREIISNNRETNSGGSKKVYTFPKLNN